MENEGLTSTEMASFGMIEAAGNKLYNSIGSDEDKNNYGNAVEKGLIFTRYLLPILNATVRHYAEVLKREDKTGKLICKIMDDLYDEVYKNIKSSYAEIVEQKQIQFYKDLIGILRCEEDFSYDTITVRMEYLSKHLEYFKEFQNEMNKAIDKWHKNMLSSDHKVHILKRLIGFMGHLQTGYIVSLLESLKFPLENVSNFLAETIKLKEYFWAPLELTEDGLLP